MAFWSATIDGDDCAWNKGRQTPLTPKQTGVRLVVCYAAGGALASCRFCGVRGRVNFAQVGS